MFMVMRYDRAPWYLHTKGDMQASLRMLDILCLAGAAGILAWVNCPCHPQSSHDCLGCLVLSLSLSSSWATMGLSKSIQISPCHSLRGETSPPFQQKGCPPPLPPQALPSSHSRTSKPHASEEANPMGEPGRVKGLALE